MGAALITGASAGLGAEFARQLAAKGLDLVLVARRLEKLNEVKQEIESRYPNICIGLIEGDLSQPATPSSHRRTDQRAGYRSALFGE